MMWESGEEAWESRPVNGILEKQRKRCGVKFAL